MIMTTLASFESPEIMTDASALVPAKRRQRNKFLLLISAYKLLQALLFAAVGFGAIRLLHKDIGDVLSDLASAMRFNPESHFINFILEKATLLNDPILRRIGVVAFCYSGISLAECIGLYLEKTWGEVLTLLITASFLPWEVFEIFRKLTSLRVGLLIINLLVFLYLLKEVASRKNQSEPEPAVESHPQSD